ncbi:hypothetical protein ABEB36_003751 [Hypothenemus hampei]|uniref:Leucine-rich repeat-containing protein 20 n=1 Tax=Hypothenemus hampei TaxID=57062 RepID=A0ABD1F103_HYPHA
MAESVTRVIHRCNDAKESENLDLSNCQLIQVPDAVYHLMRHTKLKSCDFSDNVITKILPEFPIKFNSITNLNLSHNQITKLPRECAELNNLEILDISYNSFMSLPHCLFKMPKLRSLKANDNYIMDIEVNDLTETPALECIDLERNPLARHIHDQLSRITKLVIVLSPQQTEDWEDLTI